MTARTRHTFSAGLSIVALAIVTACAMSNTTDKVTGMRDDVHHVTQKIGPATRPHMISICKNRTKRVPHTSTSRTKTGTTTRTWTTTETVRDCHREQRGVENYTRITRSERWCVELDNVNGKKRRDDVWFQVDPRTYATALAADEGQKLTFTPRSTGC